MFDIHMLCLVCSVFIQDTLSPRTRTLCVIPPPQMIKRHDKRTYKLKLEQTKKIITHGKYKKNITKRCSNPPNL